VPNAAHSEIVMADCNVSFESLRTGTAHAESNCNIKKSKKKALDPLLALKKTDSKRNSLEFELGPKY
jgi:hypothetical protein